MMASREFDKIVIGKSFLSYLYALSFVRKGKDVFLLDDPRIFYGENYTSYIGDLERIYLEKCGYLFDIDPLKNIQKYLIKCPTTIYLDHVRVRLGDSPYSNLLELKRKLPFINEITDFPGSDFDELVDYYFNDTISYFMNIKEWKSITKSCFLADAPSLIKELMNKLLKGEQDNLFYLLSRFLFNSNLNGESTDLEMCYLVCGLLGRRYRVDINHLEQDMHHLFLENGGEIYNSQIQDWQMNKGRVYGVLLSSYEGFIKAKELNVLSCNQSIYPFKTNTCGQIYNSLEISLTLKEYLFEKLIGDRGVFSDTTVMGTELSLGDIYYETAYKCTAKFPYPALEGNKADFYKASAKSRLIDFLKTNCFAFSEEQIDDISFKEGKDQWYKVENQTSKGKVINYTEPKLQEVVKNVEFKLPVRYQGMGNLLLMKEILDFYR